MLGRAPQHDEWRMVLLLALCGSPCPWAVARRPPLRQPVGGYRLGGCLCEREASRSLYVSGTMIKTGAGGVVGETRQGREVTINAVGNAWLPKDDQRACPPSHNPHSSSPFKGLSSLRCSVVPHRKERAAA